MKTNAANGNTNEYKHLRFMRQFLPGEKNDKDQADCYAACPDESRRNSAASLLAGSWQYFAEKLHKLLKNRDCCRFRAASPRKCLDFAVATAYPEEFAVTAGNCRQKTAPSNE